jgi:hypothetical protein
MEGIKQNGGAMNQPVAQAIEFIRAGNRSEAGKILSDYVHENPEDDDAWTWLSACVKEPEQKIFCLNKALQINPANNRARTALDKLGNAVVLPNLAFAGAMDIDGKPIQRSLTDQLRSLGASVLNRFTWQYGVIALLLMMTLGVFTLILLALNNPKLQPPPAPGSITGVVTWESNGAAKTAVFGISIKVWNYLGLAVVGDGITDATGKFRVINLPAGTYMVSAYQPASSIGKQTTVKCWAIKEIVVKAGQTAQVVLSKENALSEEGMFAYAKQCQ